MGTTSAVWSSDDPEARRGDPFFDLERPAGSGQRASTTMGGIPGSMISMVGDLVEAARGEESVVVTENGVDVTTNEGRTVVAWDDLDRAAYVKQLGDPADRPVSVLHLVDGSTVPLPNSLYPDAAGDFSSMRHTARARAVVASINDERPDPT